MCKTMERQMCFRYVILLSLALCFYSATFIDRVAGNCFSGINRSTKKCKGFLYKNLSVAECCSRGGAYYTLQNVSFGTLFRDMIHDSVIPTKKGPDLFKKFQRGNDDCYSCKDWKSNLRPVTCENKKCRLGRVCKEINNNARCVCPKTNCSSSNSIKVCSNFNITYQSECHLKMHACRKVREEWVEYNGSCKASCNQVRCSANKQCIQDTINQLYCVHCNNKPCNEPVSNDTTVCGLNNVTYPSACHLRKATCKFGKTIGIAYTGNCRDVANCNNIKCTSGQRCIMNGTKPLCFDCTTSCKHWTRRPFRYYTRNVCGSDGVTYPSFCALEKNICLKNVDINVVNYGPCKRKSSTDQLFSETEFKLLRKKTISLRQLVQVAYKIGFPLTLRKNVPRHVYRKRASVNTLLHYMYKFVIKSKI